jgi:hypothetical protein
LDEEDSDVVGWGYSDSEDQGSGVDDGNSGGEGVAGVRGIREISVAEYGWLLGLAILLARGVF